MKTIKLMADYHCFPLWWVTRERDDHHVGDIDPKDLSISQSLKDDLMEWAKKYDATLNQDYPPDSRFPTKEAKLQFEKQGKELWKHLKKELKGTFEIHYYSAVENRLYKE